MTDLKTTDPRDLCHRLEALGRHIAQMDSGSDDAALILTAADEIDRLRAERRLLRGALRALVEWGREVPAPRDTDHRERGYLAFDKAKRALRGKR